MSQQTKRQFRIGPLLESPNGSLFCVVPARTLNEGQPIIMDDGSTLGRYEGGRQSATFLGLPAMTDLVGLVKIAPEARLSSSTSPVFERLASLEDNIGKTVTKIDASGRPVARGRLNAVLSTMHLVGEGAAERHFHGALEIQIDDPSFAQAGDAGATIITEDGAVLGILIAKAGDIAFAVPMRDILACFELSLAPSGALEEHEAAQRRQDDAGQSSEAVQHAASLFSRSLASFYGGQLALDRKAQAISHRESNVLGRYAPLVHVDDWHIHAFDPDFATLPDTQPPVRRGSFTPKLVLDGLFDAAPRTPLKVLSERLRDEPATALHKPGLIGVPLNYVSGLEPALAELNLRRQEFGMRLVRQRPRNGSAAEAFDLFHRHFERIKTSDLKAVAYGRAVSMETVLICIIVVNELADNEGVKVPWDQAYVEPAVFAIDDDRDELSTFLKRDRSAMRAVEDRFRTWSEMAPALKGQPVAKLVKEAASGHAMRFRTACAVDASVAHVFGRPLKWRAVHEGQQNVVASATDNRISMQA